MKTPITQILVLTVVLSISCTNMKNNKADIIEKKVDSLLSQMTLEEKISLIHASSSFTSGGVERLGIPEIVMSDGPHGVRMEHGRDWKVDTDIDDSVSYLPVGMCLASTWNKDLGYKFGSVLGSEARSRGKDIILGPGINIIRTPLCGRNFEYLTEDPYLNSRMVVGYIKGVQDNGIAACVKHYIANNQEVWRTSVDVQMSDRAFHEIYLPGFKAAVQEANVYTLMGAYNKYRGQWCSHNEYLNNIVLRNELGFNGVVISDWGAVHDTKEALLYGTDIEMGTDLLQDSINYNAFYLADSAKEMVQSGEVSLEVLDEKVKNILRLNYRIDNFNRPEGGERNTKLHQQTALKVAEEGIVLLKNEGILPLNKNIKKIAVIGDNATRKHAHGGGSSQVQALYEVTPLEGLQRLVGDKIELDFAQGYTANYEYKGDEDLMNEAAAKAASADIAIYFGGWLHGLDNAGWAKHCFDCEASDKENIDLLFEQDELIEKVLESNPNTIIVLFGGGALNIDKWRNGAKAIIQAWYPGMEGGTALANIIFGEVNPSGKLPVTFSSNIEDYSAHSPGEYPGKDKVVNYFDDIFVGYRHFDKNNIEPQFCFGHGLSYTTFDYSNLKLSNSGNDVSVSFTITNSGKSNGAEVAQLYISDVECSVERPIKELKGFEKIYLKAGESKTVLLILQQQDFSFYSEEQKQWVFEKGDFNIQIGSSSRDIRLNETIEL